MNAMMLNIADLIISNQTNAKSQTKQVSNFSNLLSRQTESLPAMDDLTVPPQLNQDQQLADMYEKLEDLLPEEVLAILKDNTVLQEELAAIVMQGLSSQQEVALAEDSQESRLIENLLNRNLSPLNQLETTDETKAGVETVKDIYNEIINLLQGIGKTADIDDTASLLTKLLQDWEGFFQENPEMDKKEVLNHIHQQTQRADASTFEQTANQMAYRLLEADLPKEAEANDNLNKTEVNKVLQGLNQILFSVDSSTAERTVKQIADLLAVSDMEEEILQDIRSNTGQTDNGPAKNGNSEEQQTRIQQLVDAINQQMRRADSAVAEQTAKQILKQLQAWNLSEELLVKPSEATASKLGTEESQRIEARIAGWLQSVFKEVSPGVMKRNSDVNLTGQTAAQPEKTAFEAAQRTEPKMAAWLQTSFQDGSPAVFRQESLPISKVEQFIVNMAQTDPSKALSGKELIDKIESLVQSQRLYSFVRGQNPISIQLRPENLGDMTIRFVQTNGELTVQMLVSSKAVKEVLESNLHQLRNVFSPHQVTIEKQDNVMLSNGTDASKNSKENQNDQQQGDHYEESSESNEQKQYSETESFESFMEKLLAQNEEEQIQNEISL